MKWKRLGTDEVIRKVREGDAMEGSVQPLVSICQRLEISGQARFPWRNQFHGMGDGQIKRLKALDEENRRLKKAVVDLVLDKQIIKDVLRGKD